MVKRDEKEQRRMATDNSEIENNGLIQQRLARLTHRSLWLEALSAVLHAGASGIGQKTLMRRIALRNKGTTIANTVAENLSQEFHEVVRQDHRNRFYWREPEPDIEGMNPSARILIETTVSLIYTTQQIMRRLTQEHGTFTAEDVVEAVAVYLDADEQAISERVTGIVQRSGFLCAHCDDGLRVQEPIPVTRKQNITLFRDLTRLGARRKP